MRRVKQTSRKKRTTKAAAVTVLGTAGLGLSLFGSASGSTMPTAYIPQTDDTSPNQRFVLGEEEMADVSLATLRQRWPQKLLSVRITPAKGKGFTTAHASESWSHSGPDGTLVPVVGMQNSNALSMCSR